MSDSTQAYKAHKLPIDPIITRIETKDIRYPTSLDKTGSDAMNAAGDYSSAYCYIHTNSPSPSHTGIGMTFTIGRGNDIITACIPYIANRLIGRSLSSLTNNFGATWHWLTSDSQIRWIGPEKGVTQMALGAVVNAIWDLWAKVLEKPVWRVVAEMSAEELVRCVSFRYIEDALTPAEAVAMLERVAASGESGGKEARFADALRDEAVPAYTTSAGWLGYSKEKMQSLLRETMAQGYKHFKMKVGTSIAQDRERLAIAREVIGYDKGNVLMVDANQVWGVNQAISWMKELAEFKPWFIEEPTSPDEILGHATIRQALKPLGICVATGEMVQNRVVFKQMLQAGSIDVLQADACRVGGLNEVLAILLLAKKFEIPVVPHSGGCGLNEYTTHISTIDYISISGKKSLLEYIDSLHEHYVNPSSVRNGYIVTPKVAGYNVEMKEESIPLFEFPGGEKSFWRSEEAKHILTGLEL